MYICTLYLSLFISWCKRKKNIRGEGIPITLKKCNSLEGDLKKNVLSNLTYWVDCDSNWYYVSLHRNLVCKSTGISQWRNIPGRFVIIVPFLIVGSENWRQFNNHNFIRYYQKKKFDDINEFKIVCNPSDTLDVMTKFTWDSFVENMILFIKNVIKM